MADGTPFAGSAPPLYHDISPTRLWMRRIFSAVTIGMVALAMLFCLIQGRIDGTFYLLFVNLIISCVIISFLLWWYRTGDLSANKFWFIILVASIIIFQCITTDIFVFNHEKVVTTPSVAPPTKLTPISVGPPNKTTTKPPVQAPYQNAIENVFTLANVVAPPEG